MIILSIYVSPGIQKCFCCYAAAKAYANTGEFYYSEKELRGYLAQYNIASRSSLDTYDTYSPVVQKAPATEYQHYSLTDLVNQAKECKRVIQQAPDMTDQAETTFEQLLDAINHNLQAMRPQAQSIHGLLQTKNELQILKDNCPALEDFMYSHNFKNVDCAVQAFAQLKETCRIQEGNVYHAMAQKFAVRPVKTTQRIDSLSLEEACAYLVADPKNEALTKQISKESAKFVLYLKRIRTDDLIELGNKLYAQRYQDPADVFSEQQYYKVIDARIWMYNAVQARIAFYRTYTGAGAYNIDLRSVAQYIFENQQKWQATPVQLAVPKNLCSTYAWLTGKKDEWQNFAQAHQFLQQPEPPRHGSGQSIDVVNYYATLVYNMSALRNMYIYAKAHPEVFMEGKPLYKYIKHDIKVAGERIERIEYPGQFVGEVQVLDGTGADAQAQDFVSAQLSKDQEPMRLSEEALYNELEALGHEQRIKDKHDTGKQFKAFLGNIAARHLFCISLGSVWGDGSGQMRTTGHIGPMQVFSSTTSVPDFSHLFSSAPQRTPDTRAQESIECAKKLRLATIVCAARKLSTAPAAQQPASAVAAAEAQVHVIQGAAAVMEPVAAAQAKAKQRTGSPAIFMDSGTKLDTKVSLAALDMATTVPSGPVAAAADTHVVQGQAAVLTPVATVQQARDSRQVLQYAARVLAHNKLAQKDPLADALKPLEPVLILSGSMPIAQQKVLVDFVQTIAGAHYAAIDAEQHGNVEQATNWAGLRDTLSSLYSSYLRASGLDQFGRKCDDPLYDLSFNTFDDYGQKWDEQQTIALAKVAKGTVIGGAKGAVDFGQGTYKLVVYPRETAKELESGINRLEYYLTSLANNNPEAWASVRAAIKRFYDAPLDEKSEFVTRIIVGFRIAPELAGKGLGYIFNVAKEAELLEKAAETADSLGKKIVKAGEAIAAEAKVTTAPEAVTAEGLRVPAIEGEAPAAEPFVAEMEGEKIKTGVGEINPTVNWAEVEEIAKHNSTFKAQVAADAPELEVEFLEDKLPHIFDTREGHLPDTPEDRALLLEVASDPKNYFSKPDKHGNTWCEKFLEDGTQVWASLRNNKIRNGGLNLVPIKWNPETGLASLTLPK